tara:strand:+ start:908 stop:1096 length:189 start_codon:yes stop_codon:yes gene_type:complete
MNLYKPSTELESWQQMVVRLTKERDELVARNKDLEKENLELKRRCCDLWKEVTEERAKECPR